LVEIEHDHGLIKEEHPIVYLGVAWLPIDYQREKNYRQGYVELELEAVVVFEDHQDQGNYEPSR
jgi:hypothetical protein